MKRILAVIFLLSVVACGGGAGGGTPGPAGANGANGADGAAGPQGDPGIAPIPAGTVSSTDKIAVVSGTLTPDAGVPASEISGATVYAVGQQGSGATTDASGGYTLTVDLNSASQIAVVQKPLLQRIAGWLKGGPKAATALTQVGFVSISPTNAHGKKINLSLQEGTAVNLPNITITTVGKISGNVKLQNGTDHTGIMVYIPGTSFLALTDASGNFTITNVPEGDYSYLRASISGYKHSMLSTITVASNATTTVRDQLLLIDTGATGSLLINTGAAVSANKQVTVNVAASSTAILMLYSESSIFLNAAWEPLQSSFTYTFATEGAKTLYIKFADANGLESPVYSDSITVNSNWQTPLTLPSSGARTNDTTPTFTWTADSLAATYGLVISKNADLSTPDLTVPGIAAATYTLTAGQALPVSAGQLYYWSVRPVDAIGVAGAYATASSFTLDTTAPTVSSKTPAADAVSVATTSLVSAVFGEALDANSLAAGTFTVATTTGSVQKTGAITYDSATKTATFTPTGNLVGTTGYTASLTTAIKDAAGNPLAALYSWNFTTTAGWVHPSGVSDDVSTTGLSTMGVSIADVAMNASGDIALVWLDKDTSDQTTYAACSGPCTRVYVATFSRATRTWTYPAVSGSLSVVAGNKSVESAKVAMADNGNILVAWKQQDAGGHTQIYKAEYTASSSTWAKPANIGDHISIVGNGGTNNGREYAVAMDNTLSVIAWLQDTSTAMGLFRGTKSGGAWTWPADDTAFVMVAGVTQVVPALSVANGKALLAWVYYSTIAAASNNRIYVSRYNGGWTDPADNTVYWSVNTTHAVYPEVAMSADGTGIVVWHQTDAASKEQVYAATWNGAGWTKPATLADNLSPDNTSAQYPKVAMDGNGKGIVVWSQNDDTTLCNWSGCAQMFMASWSGAAWTKPSGLSDNISLNGQSVSSTYGVAMDAAGNAIIVQEQYTGSATALFTSEYRSAAWTHPASVTNGFATNLASGKAPTGIVVKMGNGGEAVIVWGEQDDTLNCTAMACLQTYKSEYR